jgi:hypothetical protein
MLNSPITFSRKLTGVVPPKPLLAAALFYSPFDVLYITNMGDQKMREIHRMFRYIHANRSHSLSRPFQI